MPNKVYMPDEPHSGGGTAFLVSWERLESMLRGKDTHAGTYAMLQPDESAEFVIEPDGVTVYVSKRG